MLVLSRVRDEQVLIDFSAMSDDELRALREKPMEVVLCDLRGDKARLGFLGPKSVQIHRREVYDAIRREQRDGHRESRTAGNDGYVGRRGGQ